MDQLYFAKAFDQSAVAMAFLQSDGMILGANPALIRSLGKDLWVVVGSSIVDHLSPEEHEKWNSYFDVVRSHRSDEGFECAYLTAQGERRWWNLHVSNLELAWAGLPTYFAVLQDVTDRRLAEENLRKARRQAEGASRAKSEFLANMSHEIRTPLFTITGMTDLLRSGDLHRDQARQAGQIASAAQHLLDLVNDVLDFSKIEAGQMELESIPFALEDVVARSLEVVTLGAYRKGLEVVLDLHPDVPPVWKGDPSRVRQILVNLLSNAVKFTSQGRVVVSVEPGLTIHVRDTGIGMSEDTLTALFLPFSQADASTTREYGGSGLGLAISRRLALLMGGDIEVTSKAGEGSAFSFHAPLQPLEEPQPPTGGMGRGLFLAEDDDELRELLTRRLEDAGFRVWAAGTRSEALELVHQPWDVALIDQELGPDDGWGLASELRSSPEADKKPFILLSLLNRAFEPSPRFAPGLFQGDVSKPINVRSLVTLLVHGFETGDWAPRANERDPTSTYERRASGFRLLVAEDHEVNRELFRMLLQSLGHEVRAVINGREACVEAGPFRPHMVFMDLQMPEMNGYEAAQKLRASGLVCPIVAVTASALQGELERCLAAGMDGVLTKPFTRETLRAVLEQWLGLPAGRPAPPSLDSDDSDGDFSWDEAEHVFLGNRDLLENVIERFRLAGADLLASIEHAASTGDRESVHRAAHALKGSAANLTARRLALSAEALERASAELSPQDWSELVVQLRERWTEFGRLVDQR